MYDLLWFGIGFVSCFLVHVYEKRRLLKQLEKVTDSDKLNDFWKGGVRYAASQIERIW